MANFAKYTAAQLERLINDVYSGIVTVHNLPVDLYNATLGSLTDAVKRGFGGSFENLSDGSPDKLLAQYYANNIGVFSGAKTWQQVNDMSNLVFESDGYKRDFSEFKRLIKGDKFHQGIFNKYNDQYLRTEYDTAFRTAQMGKQWNQYVDDADALPYLQYKTIHDERVRHDHAAFDGITLPIGHKFWNTHTPPNGFNCRCRLIQLSDDDNPIMTDPNVIKGIPKPDSPLFEFNPGKHGVIFDEKKHPYSVKINERFSVAQKSNFGMPTPPKPKEPLPRPKLPTTPAKGIKTGELTLNKINTVPLASQYAGKIFKKAGFNVKSIEMDPVNFSVAKATRYVGQLENLLDEYEPFRDYRFDAKIDKLQFNSNGKAWGFVESSSSGANLHRVNFGHGTDPFVARELDVKSRNLRGKSRVDKKNSEISTLTHEFAHLITTERQSLFWNLEDERIVPFWNEIRSLRRKYRADLKKTMTAIRKDASNAKLIEEYQLLYIGKYGNTNHDEFLAECFTEYKLSSNPGKYPLAVGKIIDQYFKRK